jgi:hypothetical protein
MFRPLLARPVRRHQRQARPLSFQPLEARALMATIPVLNSLPGAAHTLYLDFDGDFQSVWNRTDSGQTYRNVNVGEFNLDNTPGFSDAEASAMKKIWETVAEDYAPFNINVTTVAPASFANGAAVRVVMAGNCSAQLVTGPSTSININGSVFVADNSGNPLDTSGYSSVGSFSDNEPNVVYVFAKYINTWGTTDSEGRTRNLQYVMATTASHEAGHSFGLVHHGNYDVGTDITTPIMGSNTQGDRSLWSTYGTNDNLQQLTNLLGARADDYASSLYGAGNLPFQSTSVFGPATATVKGIISTAADSDWFRFSSSGGVYQFNLNVLQYANLDAKLEVYKITKTWWGFEYAQLGISEDPQVYPFNPFANLGASFAATMPAGNYAVVVRSHGGYGDLGNYTLHVSKPSERLVINPGYFYEAASSTSSTSLSYDPTLAAMAGGAGQGTKKQYAAAADSLFAEW